MLSITNTMPEAYAKIKGNKKYPNLKGTVSFLSLIHISEPTRPY